MSRTKYRTTPEPTTRMPGGIPFIIGNEAAERFSFYGMKAILFVFMTEYLLRRDGSDDLMTDSQASFWFHLFVMSAYFFPIIGAVLSDAFLGKYMTIMSLSIVYCFGHLALAVDETRLGLFAGLTLIAIGSGGIKPCVSAHVGDQFGRQNQHLLERVFGWFYFAINLGAFASTLLTPLLLQRFGPSVAFGVPGVLMGLATLIFWLGRRRYAHVPPGGMDSVREAFSDEGRKAMWSLIPIYLCIGMFWALFDQTGSTWVAQAKRMDREWLGVEWLPSQVQAVNPILILTLIPVFSYLVYPAVNRVFRLNPLRKISIGLFVAALSFVVIAWAEARITGGLVLRATSTAHNAEWEYPADTILDSETDGTGWVSDGREKYLRNKKEMFPQELVIRLREGKSWKISSVRINPYVDLTPFLLEEDRRARARMSDQEQRQQVVYEQGSPELLERVRSCWAKDVEILVGNTPQGDRIAHPNGETTWKWIRSVGQITLDAEDEFQALDFEPEVAEYVMARVRSNHGGEHVCLGEIQVIASGSPPSDAHPHATAVWPNVAAIGDQPNIVWQLLAYLVITAAEVMVSITALEFSYTQAPRKMKSFIMALYLLSVTVGNLFVALVNKYAEGPGGTSRLERVEYYWFFILAMLATAVVFILVAKSYRGRTYTQDEAVGTGDARDPAVQSDSGDV